MRRIGFDLLAEQGHQRPQVFGLFDRVRPPHCLEQRTVGQHPVLVARQQREQFEFLRCEPKFDITAKHTPPVVVDGKISCAE